jgi:uncharacterized repeat protein (TIGR04052 family)
MTMIHHVASRLRFAVPACAVALAACDSDPDEDPAAFSLRFSAVVDGQEVGCTDQLTGFGPNGDAAIGVSDLRFYVSNVRFTDSAGQPVELTLDVNDFQYTDANGSVALVDLTAASDGSCAASSIAFAEGTERTHSAITGQTLVEQVAGVSFDVGVPQAVMKAVIAEHTEEGAPSPLNEMYWNWNSGYRHVVFNFAVDAAGGESGAGYVHVGSRDCAPDAGKALEDRDACTYVNTPTVSLPALDLASQSVALDLRQVLEGVDFLSPIYDPDTFEVIGEGPGVECHSSPMQPDCAPIFTRFGLDMATGAASAAANAAFVAR